MQDENLVLKLPNVNLPLILFINHQWKNVFLACGSQSYHLLCHHKFNLALFGYLNHEAVRWLSFVQGFQKRSIVKCPRLRQSQKFAVAYWAKEDPLQDLGCFLCSWHNPVLCWKHRRLAVRTPALDLTSLGQSLPFLGLSSVFWNPKGLQSLPLNSLLASIFPENNGGVLMWENWHYTVGQQSGILDTPFLVYTMMR